MIKSLTSSMIALTILTFTNNHTFASHPQKEPSEKNFQQAFKWFKEAAQQNHAYAQNNLGIMYTNGEAIDQNHPEALKWYTKAAEQDKSIAQVNIIRIYTQGRTGVPRNEIMAFKWSLRYLNSYKDSDIKAWIQPKIKKAFVVDVDQNLEKDFFESLNQLNSNLQDILGIYDQGILINNPTSGFKEQTVAISSLRDKYQQLIDFDLQTQAVFKVLTHPDFMIDCLKVKDQNFLASLQQSTEIKAHSFNAKTYLTFGKENVELADFLISLLSDQNTSINITLSELTTLEENVLKYHQTTYPILEGDYFPVSTIKARIAQDQVCYDLAQGPSKHHLMIEELGTRIESFKALAQVPDQLKALLEETQAYRNQGWVKANPIFKDLEG